MQLVFLFLTSVPAEEGKQDWQGGSGKEAGLNTKAHFGGGGKQEGNLGYILLSSPPKGKCSKQNC